jgi:hypothetical protein
MQQILWKLMLLDAGSVWNLATIWGFQTSVGRGVVGCRSYAACYVKRNFLVLRTYLTDMLLASRDSSVGIALGCGLDVRGSRVRFPAGTGNFSLHHRVQNGSGPTQPPIQWVPGALSLGVKWPGREVDHSPPSSAEVKNEWSYTSTP